MITRAQIDAARAELAHRRRVRRGGVPQAQARLNRLITEALAEHFAEPQAAGEVLPLKPREPTGMFSRFWSAMQRRREPPAGVTP